jgi:hypothetical protein
MDLNPLVPASYDVVFALSLIVLVGMVIAALISIGRNGSKLGSTQSLVWVLLVIFVPAIGSLAWFLAGRPLARQQRDHTTDH